jgi:hypothetical protein
LGLIVLLWPVSAPARLVPCGDGVEVVRQVPEALARLRKSIDPCGESVRILAVLEKVEHCARKIYQVCASTSIARNVFDRPIERFGTRVPRTITWNPELQTELEINCAGDPSIPLLRDPTASLLHELVHAAQDCDGLNPGEHELEAVRIENIYRRAAGLCQRSGYGEMALPDAMVTACPTASPCSCSTPGDSPRRAPPSASLTRVDAGSSSDGATMDGARQTSGDRPAPSRPQNERSP